MIRQAAFLAVFVVASVPLVAEAMQGTPQEQAACRGDVRKYCHNELGPGGDLLGCLQAHRAKLRPVCRAVLANHGV